MEATKKKEVASKKEAKLPPPPNGTVLRTFNQDDIWVTVWARDRLVKGQARTFYDTSFSRSYKDRDGHFQYTKSFGVDDLGKLIQLAEQANSYLKELVQKETALQ